MKNRRFSIESFYLRQALYRLGLVLGLFMFCCICFFIFNFSKLPTPSVSTFFWGIRFDLSAAIYINILLLLSYLVPFGFRKDKILRGLVIHQIQLQNPDFFKGMEDAYKPQITALEEEIKELKK